MTEGNILPSQPAASTLAPNASVVHPPPPTSSSSKSNVLPASVSSTFAEHQDPMSLPRDAKLVSLILQAMDIPDYDPRVLPQLLEFMHRYVLDILADSQLFAEHAMRNTVEVEDIRLAVEGKVAHSFTGGPSREVLAELALQRNSTSLPLMQEKYGLRLPPERNCLTGVNFSIVPQKLAVPVQEPTVQLSSAIQPSWAMNTGPSMGISRPGSMAMAAPAPPPMVLPNPSSMPAPMPMAASRHVAFSNAMEEDYDDGDGEEPKPAQNQLAGASNGQVRGAIQGEDMDFD
ncbi:Transcription initiation factor TFIID subunit 9B [Phlyctochytrium planicorne]|nr:Transcription initiation factor TFIID subunit 9B [Phlyctochytrium planicorne]